MIVFMDIDGVLADIEHRLHYLKEKNYDKFYAPEELAKDEAIHRGRTLLADLSMVHVVVLVTGRPERTRASTLMWLREHIYVGVSSILMRKDGDYRPSDIVKTELISDYFDNHRLEEGFFIDDDPKNVKAIKKAFPLITGILFDTRKEQE